MKNKTYLKDKESLINLFFRGLAILSKFLIVYYILFRSDTTDLGFFNIFTANISICSLIIGFEFYNHAIRQLVRTKSINRLSLIKDQFILHFFVYSIFFLIITFFDFNYNSTFLKLFFIITVLENANQQLFLIFIALGKSTTSSFLFFIRNALWFFVYVFLDYLNIITYSLSSLINFWLYGLLLCLVLSITFLFKYVDFKLFPINFTYIKEGFKVSIIYIGGAIVYKFFELGDRYIINFFLDKSSVGIYTFFFGIASLLPIIIYNMIIVETPKIIKSVESDKWIKYYNLIIVKTKKILTISSFLLIGILPFALIILSNENLNNYFYLILILIPAMYYNSLQTITNSFLYSMNKDRFLQKSILFAFLINILLSFLLIIFIGLYGSAIAILIANIFLFYNKHNFLIKHHE